MESNHGGQPMSKFEGLSVLSDLSHDPQPPHITLRDILQIIDDVYHLDAGVIYVADNNKKELFCIAQNGCDALTGPEGAPRFNFESRSLAAKVRTEKTGYFSATPWTDHENVSPAGVQFFRIQTPVVAVPLKLEDSVLGVLVMWSTGSHVPEPKHIQLLAPFANLAANLLAISALEQHRARAFHKLPAILAQTQREVSQKAALKSIMEALPFDRVRIYEYDANSRTFIGMDSLGMRDPDGFLSTRISVDRNPFAAHTVNELAKAPRAEIYRESDPDAKVTEKPEGLPWAVVPLVFNKELIGQIVVDNAQTRRPITPDAKEYLFDISAFALTAIANRRSVQFLSLASLPALYSSLAFDIDRLNVIRRLLVYLTSGEALGFSRAIFLEWRDQPERLVYRASIGSLTEKRFQEIGESVANQSLADVLQNAPNIYDYDIDAKFKDFQIDLSNDSGLLQDVQRRRLTMAPSGSDWLDDLANRIGEGGVLTAPLLTEKRKVGLFIVDRRWQPRQIEKMDEDTLRTFAQLASRVIEQNDFQLENARRQTDEDWKNMAKFAHECMSPASTIVYHLSAVKRALAAGHTAAVHRRLKKIWKEVDEIKAFLNDFLSLTEKIEAGPIRLEPLLRRARYSLKSGSKGVDFQIVCKPGLTVLGDRRRLHACFHELFSNALYSFDKDRKCIRVEVDTPSVNMTPLSLDTAVPYALVFIEDNGAGVATIDDRIYKVGYTNRANKDGHGFGLYMVKRTIEAHNGMITHYGRLGRGTTFCMFLPLAKSSSRSRNLNLDVPQEIL